MEHLEELKTILYEHFGEDRVDIIPTCFSAEVDGYDLLIYYPEVIIKNEHDCQHTIKDLYVKIYLTPMLHIYNTISGIRTTFTKEEIEARYIHSHLPSLLSPLTFNQFCLGTGPITITLSTLRNSFEPNIWRLFCIELDNYVRTESLDGGPYIKMERVGTCQVSYSRYSYNFFSVSENNAQDFKNLIGKEDFKTILEAIQKEHLNIFNWVSLDSIIVPGKSFLEIINSLTTIVLSLVKSNLIHFRDCYFLNTEYRNGVIDIVSNQIKANDVVLSPFAFKGNNMTLSIVDNTEENPTQTILLNHTLGMLLINTITKAVNIENIADGENNLYYC